jgi:hypothetical protein
MIIDGLKVMKIFVFFFSLKYMGKMAGAGAGAAQTWTGSASLIGFLFHKSRHTFAHRPKD